MYLLIPYLKKIIENTTREELKRLIAILLFVSFLSNMLVNSNVNRKFKEENEYKNHRQKRYNY